MLDPVLIKLIKSPLAMAAANIAKLGVGADQVTLVGFGLGVLSFPALVAEQYSLALAFILLSRLCDGLDGAVARIQGATDAGGFLDICLDFIFYALVPLGFIFAAPSHNALAGALLIFAFIGTATSFLAFAVMAAKRRLADPIYPHKSFYYMSGLTGASETLLFFSLFCLFPAHFATLAYCFAGLCFITAFSRIYHGYHWFTD